VTAPRPAALQDNPIWQQDNVILRSVGIDVGSAGTQVGFCKLHLRRSGEDLTSRYVVIGRSTLFRSPVRLTPYVDQRHIDAEALGVIVDDAYRAARLEPDDIDTGAVILTGEALRRDNAERITQALAARAGDLVCASAGHNMEAMLAAYGSGAARASHDGDMRILNVDLGGGTTKLALVDGGRVVATAALHVGGRLAVVTADGRIVRLELAGRRHAARAGVSWMLGDTVESSDLERVADAMADVVLDAVAGRPLPEALADLYLTEPLGDIGRLDGVMFSGGVAEYVYGCEARDFGDLGRRLGTAIRRRVNEGALPAPLLPAGERIRATVLGASQYTVQLSGNTSYISDPAALLPRRNLQVLRPDYGLDASIDPDEVATAIRAHLSAFDVGVRARASDSEPASGSEPAGGEVTADIALALAWRGAPSHGRIMALARGVASGLAERTARGYPLYLMLDGDIALTLGTLLRDELGVTGELLVIDGVSLGDFDYVDLGALRQPSNTVPVTIKSLVFGQAAPARSPS
jgi:ethanolamine utilization protein EutA